LQFLFFHAEKKACRYVRLIFLIHWTAMRHSVLVIIETVPVILLAIALWFALKTS
jgi:hypothetical protein